jgi:hypothetical protein
VNRTTWRTTCPFKIARKIRQPHGLTTVHPVAPKMKNYQLPNYQ